MNTKKSFVNHWNWMVALLILTLSMLFAACAAPSPTATPAPTSTPTPVSEATPTATPAPTDTPVPQPTPTPVPPTPTPTPLPPLTLEMLQNTTYASEWEESSTITLTDGRYEGEPFVEGGASRLIVTLVEPVAFGDLDDDGVDDAAVILAANAGGSGTFISLEVVRNKGSEPLHLATYLLGDRVRIESLAIEDGQILLEMITHGPNDPMCCPTQQVKQTYALRESELVQISSEVISPGPAAGPDIVGIVWEWQRFSDTAGQNDIVVIYPPNYRLEFRPDGQFSVKADCNVGSGTYTLEGSSLTLELGPMTLAECGPTSQYDDYIGLLEQVATYVREGDSLILNLMADSGSMIFSKLYAVTGRIVTPAEATLPEKAQVEVKVMDAAGTQVGGVTRDVTQFPIEFEATYYPPAIQPDNTYILEVTIKDKDGDPLFTNTGKRSDAYPVLTQGYPTYHVEVMVEPVGGQAPGAAVSPLTREMLKNTAYPNGWPKDGVARLVDGVYREKYMPDSATEMVISLADMQTFGDLNGDGVDDVLVILVSHPGGSGTFFDLVAVLNQDGMPNPVATAFLGDRTIIRSMTIESGQIVLEMITQGPDDPMCCPNMDRRQVYTLQDGSLNLVDQIDTPRTEPAIPRAVEPERIDFPPGVTSVTLEGSVFPIGDKRYMLHGHAGQTLSLTVTSPYDHVFLSVYGSDGAVLVSVRDETTSWTGELPRTLEYMITLVSIAGSETTYTLQVDMSIPPTPTPGPTATPVPPTPTPQPSPEARGMIYLTFDDGPVDPQWTPQVLEALASYDAKATFFVLGMLAERFPELIDSEVEAGHAVANHTFDHHTLDGIGREAFFDEIQKTEEILGEKAVKCLRPPYGATDAYTRTYLAELGYQLIFWNIDTEDWRKPGAEAIVSAVVDQAYPGAIVLFHDGGGDRAQTVEALETILETLSSQGYAFEVVCP